jgi:hypothetical protein
LLQIVQLFRHILGIHRIAIKFPTERIRILIEIPLKPLLFFFISILLILPITLTLTPSPTLLVILLMLLPLSIKILLFPSLLLPLPELIHQSGHLLGVGDVEERSSIDDLIDYDLTVLEEVWMFD